MRRRPIHRGVAPVRENVPSNRRVLGRGPNVESLLQYVIIRSQGNGNVQLDISNQI